MSPAEVARVANVLTPYGPDRQKTLVRSRFVMLFDGRIDNRPELGDILNLAANDLHLMPESMIALRLFDRELSRFC